MRDDARSLRHVATQERARLCELVDQAGARIRQANLEMADRVEQAVQFIQVESEKLRALYTAWDAECSAFKEATQTALVQLARLHAKAIEAQATVTELASNLLEAARRESPSGCPPSLVPAPMTAPAAAPREE